MNTRFLHKSGWRWLLSLIILAGLSFNLTSGASADDRAEISLENTPVRLVDPSTSEYGDFGWDLAISGDTMAVGKNSTEVLIYQKDQGGSDQWGLVKQFDTGADTDEMALDGDILYVDKQIYYRDEGGPDNWGLVHTFPFNTSPGSAVALSGSTLAVSIDDFSGGWELRIFYQDQDGADQWGEVKTITTADPDDYFGRGENTLALYGDFLLVGASRAEVGGVRCGEAHLYGRNEDGTDNWGQVKVFSPSRCELNDNFGSSVALEGQTAVVAAFNSDNDNLERVGAVYAFDQNKDGANNWGLLQVIGPASPFGQMQFGARIALFNGLMFVSSAPSSVADEIFIFQKGGGVWQQAYEILPPQNTTLVWDIWQMDISSEGLAVGMPFVEPDGITRQGAVYIFQGQGTDLGLAKTVSADEVTPGGSLTYTLTVTNAGPGQAQDLVVTDYLPNGVTLESVTGTGWTCDSSGQEIICTLPSLAASTAADPITIDVTVGASTGWINNIATLESLNLELDLRNNQQVELTQVAWPEPEGDHIVYLPLIVR